MKTPVSSAQKSVYGPPRQPASSEAELDRLGFGYGIAGKIGKALGLETASGFLDRFLDRTGRPVTLSKEKARTFDFIRNAEDKNRSRFEKSFMDMTHRYGKEIKALREGQTVDLGDDHWDVMVGPDRINPYNNNLLTDGPDAWLAFGHTRLSSKGHFFASRDQGKIHIHGDTTHTWKDRYDFAPNGSGGAGAVKLEQAGRAKAFDFGAQWNQKLYGTMNIRDGRLKDPDFIWRDTPERR